MAVTLRKPIIPAPPSLPRMPDVRLEDNAPYATIQLAQAGYSIQGGIRGTDGNDRLSGTSGNDTFIDSLGNDTYFAGVGTDTLVFRGKASDYTFGYDPRTSYFSAMHPTGPSKSEVDQFSGIEQISFTDTVAPVQLTDAVKSVWGSSAKDDIRLDSLIGVGRNLGVGRVDVLYGYAGNDYLEGSDKSEAIDGGDGDDTLYGRGGDDTLIGGEGTDTVVYKWARSRYEIRRNGDDYVVKDTASQEADVVRGIERIRFDGRETAYELESIAASPSAPLPTTTLVTLDRDAKLFERWRVSGTAAQERVALRRPFPASYGGLDTVMGNFDRDANLEIFVAPEAESFAIFGGSPRKRIYLPRQISRWPCTLVGRLIWEHAPVYPGNPGRF